jgi:hypothetical protein
MYGRRLASPEEFPVTHNDIMSTGFPPQCRNQASKSLNEQSSEGGPIEQGS